MKYAGLFLKKITWGASLLVLVWSLTLIHIAAIGETSAKATQAEKAARVNAIFQSLRENAPPGKKAPPNSHLRITEDELNAYLTQEYISKPHSGLKSVVTHLLASNRVVADAIVDVDDLKTENSSVLKMITWFFSGDQALHVQAQLLFKGNTVTYQLEDAQLNNVTLPNALVEKLIEILARRQTQKIDVTKPIPLSPTIKHVDIQKELLTILT